MHVKTYRGPNPATVFAQVKAELGEDAVILGNRTLTENGVKVCEVMAAVEPRPAAPAPQKAEDLLPAPPAGGRWQHEWGEIKDCLLSLIKPQMNLDLLSPRQRLALEYLEREGVDLKIILALFRELREDAGLSILRALEPVVPLRGWDARSWGQKFHLFCGPFGAGKTSILVRLALADKKADPRMRLCLASADSGQGKSRMVLKHYAELSGLAFRDIASAEDFAALKAESRDFDRIYVDLPGLAASATLHDKLSGLGVNGQADTATHLVLSPHFAPAQYKRFLDAYAAPSVKSIVWTKLDEACSFGAVINVAAQSGLPVSALSFGSGLKQSFAPAQAESVWRLIFKHQLPAAA